MRFLFLIEIIEGKNRIYSPFHFGSENDELLTFLKPGLG